MAVFTCERFPDGEAFIRTTAGIVAFVDGRAEVESPELVEALREVPDEFGISAEGAGVPGPAPSPPSRSKKRPTAKE